MASSNLNSWFTVSLCIKIILVLLSLSLSFLNPANLTVSGVVKLDYMSNSTSTGNRRLNSRSKNGDGGLEAQLNINVRKL